ncbi:Fic family protein [Vibrio europaeus]|uniref:Cell filamentation protein Fic n=1 Tax=Vibrio europaeus TaxID=300876 RepID=A0A178J9Q4_9VIBR|nr:Fic family protein [Vibrio europaeus]MDC5704890.1 Fic family protein [Vibrio europaeus]MDC5710169.1 Fic family protein [Vibrio europaeus]MDC5715259.1 Fic family protein [Vibrio europaeus]MDC5718887.1 Fic family protein [Vibrio europaeus]MDC5724692.1 Fic family protein [Vibrio europaeus]
MWIWEQKNWPHFYWDEAVVDPLLRKTRLNQGILLGRMTSQPQDQNKSMLDTLLANIVHSSAIEGEKLNAFSVRSSLANKLGLTEERPFPTTEQTDGLAEIMLDAVDNLDAPLTIERILHWHDRLFPDGYTLFNPVVGGQLRGTAPMQVVSGRIDRPVVHFEAPGRERLDTELDQFVAWFNHSKQNTTLDPLLRAAITHLWFVTLHPLDDGNGRITRLLTDLALAQADQQSVRFYAMSVGILANRKSYYQILEKTQKGNVDITDWVVWFLDVLNETFDEVLKEIQQTVFKTNFWRDVDQTQLTSEQAKVLNRMLDGDFVDGINTSQYHKVAKVSKPTATRHLTALVEQGCLVKSGAGRSTRYMLAKQS